MPERDPASPATLGQRQLDGHLALASATVTDDADTARRLVCDSRFQALVQDTDGRAVGLGTTARTVTPALRRALMVRDGHCR